MSGSHMRLPDLSARPFALDVERTFAIPAAALYRAWTQGFDRWFAAPGSVAMEPRVGAPFFFETEHRVEAGAPPMRHPHYGRFLRLEPDRLVEMAWVTGAGGTDGAETVVTVQLSPDDGGTRLRLRHAGFATAEARDAHAAAWPAVLAQMEEKLTAPPPAPDRAD